MRGVPLATVSNLLGHTSPTMTLRYAHRSPKYLTSAVRVLDPLRTSHLTIQPKQTPERVLAGVQKDSLEARERLDRSGERMVGAEGGI